MISPNLSFSMGFFLPVNSRPFRVFLLMQTIRAATSTDRRDTRMPTVKVLLSAQKKKYIFRTFTHCLADCSFSVNVVESGIILANDVHDFLFSAQEPTVLSSVNIKIEQATFFKEL